MLLKLVWNWWMREFLTNSDCDWISNFSLKFQIQNLSSWTKILCYAAYLENNVNKQKKNIKKQPQHISSQPKIGIMEIVLKSKSSSLNIIILHVNRKNKKTKPQIETVLHVNLSLFAYLPFCVWRPNENLRFSVMFLAMGWQIFEESMTGTDI